MANFAELSRKFGINGAAEVIEARGMPAVRVSHGGVHGLMFLHGAHVAEWHPAETEEVLWMSGKSFFEAGKPIRGGVPVCFPWFGPLAGVPTAPGHGFVRSREWELEEISQSAGGITVGMKFGSDGATRGYWPHDFVLRHRVTFGSSLVMALELTNAGKAPLKAEEALHTYFGVSDVREVKVKGLAGVRYIDKMDQRQEKTQAGDIEIVGETDRVYFDTTGTVVIEDAGKRRRIVVAKEGSRDTVVWNPWVAKSKAMSDFGDEEWPGMICVETCNVGGNAAEVMPGETRVMKAKVTVTSL